MSVPFAEEENGTRVKTQVMSENVRTLHTQVMSAVGPLTLEIVRKKCSKKKHVAQATMQNLRRFYGRGQIWIIGCSQYARTPSASNILLFRLMKLTPLSYF